MTVPLKEYNRLQMKEMEKHKWIESEKAGMDLGEPCLIDWVKKYGRDFRLHFYNHQKIENDRVSH